MQAPKKKSSKSRRDMRRSHHALSPKWLAECPSCHEPVRSHSICMFCGSYRGRVLIPNLSESKNS